MLFSQVTLLTTVLNDTPIIPEDDEEETFLLLKDSSQCVGFGVFMIWWVCHLDLLSAYNHHVQVRQHHHQSGPHLPEWRDGSQCWWPGYWTFLSSGAGETRIVSCVFLLPILLIISYAGSLPTLCVELPLDPHQPTLPDPHHVPPPQALPRFHFCWPGGFPGCVSLQLAPKHDATGKKFKWWCIDVI